MAKTDDDAVHVNVGRRARVRESASYPRSEMAPVAHQETSMYSLECELAGSVIRRPDICPILSIIIPTYNRPDELRVAVASIATQILPGMAGKVEIIISDNSGDDAGRARVQSLADEFDVSYMLHKDNQGGGFQVYSAPGRARGRWMWVFGDDDALADGGLAYILDLLEREQPAFLTVNRQVRDTTLEKVMIPAKHGLEDRKYSSFMGFLEDFGFDQVTFLTSQIYETARARQVDGDPYFTSPCFFGQVAFYIEAYHDAVTYYASRPVVVHRWDQSAASVHAANFYHLATHLPFMVRYAADQAQLVHSGLFEAINGERSLKVEPSRRITFVDNILQNLWRCTANLTEIGNDEWDVLLAMSADWRTDRREQLEMARTAHTSIIGLGKACEAAARKLVREASHKNLSAKAVLAIREDEQKILAEQAHLQEARNTALEISEVFN